MSLRLATASVSTANTNTNGTGTITDLVVGSTNGTRVDYITMRATADTTQGMLRFWSYTAGAWRLLNEIVVSETVAAPLTAKWSAIFTLPAFYVGTGQKLGVSTNNAESFHIVAMCEDY